MPCSREKISEETYRELKEKYEAELSEAQEGRDSESVEETLRRGVELVDSYLRRIDHPSGS